MQTWGGTGTAAGQESVLRAPARPRCPGHTGGCLSGEGVEKDAMSQGMQAVAPKRHPMRPGSGLIVKTAAAQGGVWASAAFRWDPHG